MKVLLTGGAGYIGSHVCLELIDNNHEVFVIDNLVNGDKNLIPPNADFLKADISDEVKVNKFIKDRKFDVVMHFAGYTRVGESTKFPEKYYENNFEKPKIFLNICTNNGLDKIIFSSTGSIYGNVESQKNIKETQALNPLNPYSNSKLKLEKHLLSLSDKKKIKCVILRYFNVAGADENKRSGLMTNPDNLIKAICEVANGNREKLVVNGDDYNTKDGTTIRDFIHVCDLAKMHIECAKYLMDGKETNIFNCGYGKGFSIKDVINEMHKILNKEIKIEYGPRRDGDAVYSVADNKKFLKHFNWKPKYDNLKTILETSLNWEKNKN